MTNPIKAVLFDLDGTLLDTAGDLVGTVNTLLARNSLSPLPDEKLRPWVSQGALTMVSIAFDLPRESGEANDLFKQFLDEYQSRISECSVFFPGMEAVVEHIENSGLSWGIVTNKPEFFTHLLLDDLKLTARAATIVCSDTVARNKPWPDPVIHACSEMKVDPKNTIMIGDDKRDIDAGSAAGTLTLAAAWGYIRPEDDLNIWGADGIVNYPHEIIDWLK